MIYTELLKMPEWQQKCNEVLERDKFTCQDCGNIGYHNNYSFMSFDNIEDIDSKLCDNIFPNFSFHELFKFMAEKLFENYNKGRFDIGNPIITNNKYIYKPSINIEEFKDKSYPFGILFLSENILGNVLNFKYKELYPGCYMLFVNQQLTQKWHVMIKSDNLWGEIIIMEYEHFIIYLRRPIQLKGLNIHHNYYINGLKPWEYDNETLITLCEKCHKKRHEREKVPIYRNRNELLGFATNCPRCNGSGYLPEYNHIEHGVCFKCGGEGVLLDNYKYE